MIFAPPTLTRKSVSIDDSSLQLISRPRSLGVCFGYSFSSNTVEKNTIGGPIRDKVFYKTTVLYSFLGNLSHLGISK